MNTRHPATRIVFVCAMLLASHRAIAQFGQQGPKLVAAAGILQGTSVSISADGNTAVVGGGPAFIWRRSGGVWSQQSAALAGSDAIQGIVDATTAVAISADGNTAIVGVPRDNHGIGAVWIWTRNGNGWIQQSPKLVASDAVVTGADYATHQGTSVALSAAGNTAIVGSPGDNHDTGAVWIWARVGEFWTQQTLELVGSGAIGGAGQGRSVAISADGNTAIVGGPGDTADNHGGAAGAAWVWTRSGGLWRQQSRLVGAGGVSFAGQGQSVALSADGNTAIVGGPGDYSGSVWVWIRNGEVWTQQGGKLFVQDFSQVQNFSSGLGFAVSLSADGNTAIIGAPWLAGPQVDPSSGLTTGTTWVWTRSGGVWHQQPAPLTGLDGVEASQGVSVSLSADGKTAIVGGYSDRNFTGAAWVFSAGVAPSPPPRRRVARH